MCATHYGLCSAAEHRHICMWKERNASNVSPGPTTARRKCHLVGREGLWSGGCGRGSEGSSPEADVSFIQGEEDQAKSPCVPAGTQGHVWVVRWAKRDEAVRAAENQIFTESRLSSLYNPKPNHQRWLDDCVRAGLASRKLTPDAVVSEVFADSG